MAAIAAAERQFLATGYESVTMDSIAKESGVAKQTLYSYFGSKRELFLALVTAKTKATAQSVLSPSPRIVDAGSARSLLRDLLVAQLSAVMASDVLALRRLVIGEMTRSPELAQALYEHGPRHAVKSLAEVIAEMNELGVLQVKDVDQAATQLNWLVMGEPVNRAMLIGDRGIPTSREIEVHVDAAVEMFFNAFGRAPEPRDTGRSRRKLAAAGDTSGSGRAGS